MVVHAPLSAPSGRTLMKASAAGGLAFTAIFGWSLRRRLRSAEDDASDGAIDVAVAEDSAIVSRVPLREHVGGAMNDTVAIPARPLRWIDARIGVGARAKVRITRIRGARIDRRRLHALDGMASDAVRRVRPAALDDFRAEPVARAKRVTRDTVRRLRARGANGRQGVSAVSTTADGSSAE